MTCGLDGSHTLGGQGLGHLLTATGLEDQKSPQQGWPYINCTLLRTGAIWAPGLELRPTGVPFKGLELPNSQGSQLPMVPGSTVHEPYVLPPIFHGLCGEAVRVVGGERLLSIEH